jgi:rRNA maturation endonuclease Nob1
MEFLLLLLILVVLIVIATRMRRGPSGLFIRRCPHCRELIPDRATVCSHCGRDVPRKRWIWERQ